MSVDVAVYRARIGKFNSANFARSSVKNKCMGTNILMLFYGLVCSILLVIGGVELNPGPQDQEVTLKDIWERLNSLDVIQKDVVQVKASMENILKELATLRTDVNRANAECDKLRKENNSLREKLDQLENQSRRSNLVFYNVQEAPDETWQQSEDTVIDIINNEMKVKIERYDIERAHRVGKKGRKDRPIIVRFNNYKKKEEVLRAKKNLSELKIGISEDYSETVRDKRRELKEYMMEAKKEGNRAQLRFDKLVVNGRYYTLEQLHTANISTSSRPTAREQATADMPLVPTETPQQQQPHLGPQDQQGQTPSVTENNGTAPSVAESSSSQGETAQGDLLNWLNVGRVTRSKAPKKTHFRK